MTLKHKDCNPRSLFSILESVIKEFIIQGSCQDYRLAEIYQRIRKKYIVFQCRATTLVHLANEINVIETKYYSPVK